MNLADFILARLNEDEAAARAATPGPWQPWTRTIGIPADAQHIVRHDPARVLADVDAKRRIVAEHSPHHHGACPVCWRVMTRSSIRQYFPCLTLRLLALPFTDHPDYREEWQLRSPGA